MAQQATPYSVMAMAESEGGGKSSEVRGVRYPDSRFPCGATVRSFRSDRRRESDSEVICSSAGAAIHHGCYHVFWLDDDSNVQRIDR